MTCEHPRKWEMRGISTYSDGTYDPWKEISAALDAGWEPYAVQEEVHWFKRSKCDLCERV